MATFPLVIIAILAGWAIFATVWALVSGRNLRQERQLHEEAQERSARYRAALKQLEERAAVVTARYNALQREHVELKLAHEAREQGGDERPIPMVVIDSLDISGEVGTLFEHVARVAAAVRNYSAYTRGHYGQEPNKARYDLLWLADCLHTFDRIGKALADGSQRSLAAACEELVAMYDAYPKDGSGYDSRDTFRRLSDKVPLLGVTEAAQSIVMKTSGVQPAPDPLVPAMAVARAG